MTGDEDEVTDGYEPGDINVVAAPADVTDGTDGPNYADDADREDYTDEGDDDGDEPGMPEEVLTFIARSLVDDPDAVAVETEEHRGGVRLHLRVDGGDMGRVIGRRGRTAQAIRTVVGVAGAMTGTQTSVDIVDD